MKELRALSEYAASMKWEDAPADAKEATINCVVDTMGVTLGAVGNPMFQSIMDVYLSVEGERDVTILGTGKCANLRTAVFFNGMAGHILELDDVHVQSKVHIGTVVIPAAWSTAEYLKKSGRDLLEAVLCGYEVAARIGKGFGVSSHRNKGWHATGTAGIFGAAAACAKLYGFNADQFEATFGLAGTQACSTWAFLADGATNKVLHPARAAASGLESCLLVKGGMRGCAEILNAPDGGIYPMMSDEYSYEAVSENLGQVFEVTKMDKKSYPCCRSTHCTIESASKLKKQYHIDPNQVEHVRLDTYLVGVKQCGLAESSKHPAIPTEAKFSTPYTIACGLIYGNVGLADFEPEAIGRPEVQALLERVEVCEDPAFTAKYPKHWGCHMYITMKNGCKYDLELEDAAGSETNPLTQEQIVDKLRACCSQYPAEWVEETAQKLLHLEQEVQLPILNHVYGGK